MMLDIKSEQKWPLTTKKCFLSQTGSSRQGSFHAASRRWQFVSGVQLIITARTRSIRYLAPGAGFLCPEAGWWYHFERIPATKKQAAKRPPNTIIIPYSACSVKRFCFSCAQICISNKDLLFILYIIAAWILVFLVISYRHKEVIPMYR